MKKKILIGSILVLTLLLLMPSIPAVQQKTIEEGIRQDIQEKLETITLDDLKYIEVLEGIKHPLLYASVVLISTFRLIRFVLLYKISESCTKTNEHGDFTITHPYLFIISLMRSAFLLGTTLFLIETCESITDKLGWNWDIPYY